MENIFGYVISCGWCSSVFVICKHCYRGHKYCSDDCRKFGYARVNGKARQKYNETQEAKLDHRDRSRRYRENLKNSVTDETSNINSETIRSPTHEQMEQALFDLEGPAKCIVCKKIVFDEGRIYGGSL